MPSPRSSQSAPSPRRPRSRRGDDQRVRYLRAATDLFLAHGREGVSVDDVVKAVGGSKTNIYTYFGDKEGLFVAVVERLCEEVLASVDDLDLAGADLETGLRTFARRLIRPLLEPRLLAFHRLILFETARFPELSKAWYQAGPEESYRRLGAFFRAHQERGTMRAVEPRTAAVLFHDGMLYDVLHRTMIGQDLAPAPDEVERVIETAVAMFLRAFALPAA